MRASAGGAPGLSGRLCWLTDIGSKLFCCVRSCLGYPHQVRKDSLDGRLRVNPGLLTTRANLSLQDTEQIMPRMPGTQNSGRYCRLQWQRNFSISNQKLA